MSIFLLGIFFASSGAADVIGVWNEKARAALDGGDACTSFFYRRRVLDTAPTQEAAYYAFQSAYTADLLRTAYEISARISDPTMLQLIEANVRVLRERSEAGTLTDAECPQRWPMCGDLIVDEHEECDDGNSAPDDGCNNECRAVARTEAVQERKEATEDRAGDKPAERSMKAVRRDRETMPSQASPTAAPAEEADPVIWPYIIGGVGGAVLLGGVIAGGLVLFSSPPSSDVIITVR